MLMEELKDFCHETSIHGLGQIANTRASGVKRLLWLGLFLVSLLYAGQQLMSSIRSKLKYFEVTYSGLFNHEKIIDSVLQIRILSDFSMDRGTSH